MVQFEIRMLTLLMVGQCLSLSYVTRSTRCEVTCVAIALSSMLHVVSTKLGHTDALCHSGLIQIVSCAINNTKY